MQKTIDFLNSIREEQLQDADTRDITVPLREPLHMKGLPYLR